MGNCLRSQAKIIQIVKPDGKILEYKASIKVKEVLSEFKGHGLSDKLPTLGLQQYLKPSIELMMGHIYYLTPLPTDPSPIQVEHKKKVRFTEPEKVEEMQSKENKSCLTVKLVISKQELKKMLENNGVVSLELDKLVSMKQKDNIKSGAEITTLDQENYGRKIWMPALKSIPELD